jgi:hypothetical protein
VETESPRSAAVERQRERLDALGPAPSAEILHALTLPDFAQADAIGSSGQPSDRTFGERRLANISFELEAAPRRLRVLLAGVTMRRQPVHPL